MTGTRHGLRRMVANRLVSVYGASPARHFDGKAGQPSQSESSRLPRTGNPDQGGKGIRPDRAAVIRAIQAAGTTSFASVADVLNERGIKSARGGKWHVSSVANVLAGRQANLAIAFFIDAKNSDTSPRSLQFCWPAWRSPAPAAQEPIASRRRAGAFLVVQKRNRVA